MISSFLIQTISHVLKPESRLDFDLLRASRDGDSFQVRRVLDSGRVHVDCMDEEVIYHKAKQRHLNHNLNFALRTEVLLL